MKYTLVMLVITILVSCGKTPLEKNDYKLKDWTETYKIHVFCSCLEEGYKNDTILKLMRKKDPIVVYNEIAYDDLDKAYKLGKQVSDNIPEVVLPFEDRDGKVNVKKKFIIKTCLDYFQSKELDSITNSEFKKYNFQ